jgi:two-component system, chemotaxis family, chemotaxis protein CheY
MIDKATMAILVVDDSGTMRRIVINTLARCGFTNVSEAGDGLQALAKCGEKQFDCILTDWNMPEMDGLNFVIQLRQKPNYTKVPIMMVTTEGGRNDIVEALTRGVTSYTVKPFTPEILKAKMEELTAKIQLPDPSVK